MIFSYFYDPEKTHLINCGFDVQKITELSNNRYEMSFILYVEEVKDNVIIKKEEMQRVFSFSKNSDIEDLEFIRERYGDEKKWVFEVRNRKNETQFAMIGLLTETAKNNPLGVNIIHNSDLFTSRVMGSNLAAIEEHIKGPIVRQTIIRSDFTEQGLPSGFHSNSSRIESGLVSLKDFKVNFREPIPNYNAFTIEMDIAPTSTNTQAHSNYICSLRIGELGSIYIYRNHFLYVRYKESMDQGTIVPFGEDLNAEDFYQDGKFTKNAKLIIDTDGKYSLSITYAQKNLLTTYSPEAVIEDVEMIAGINEEYEQIEHKLSNIYIHYRR